MDFFINFVRILSLLSVVLAALWLVAPKGFSAGMFRYAMGLMVVSMIVSTLNVAVTSAPKELPEISFPKESDSAEAINITTTEYLLEELMNNCSIKFKEVTVIMDNNEDSGINITRAYIDFLNDEDFNRAAEIVKNQTGITLIKQEG